MKLFRCLAALTLFSQLAWAGSAAQCGVKNRHLVVEATDPDDRGGRVSVRLHDFLSLASNPYMEWNIEAGSASSVTYRDSFGFSWTPQVIAGGVSHCHVRVEQNESHLDVDVDCKQLHNETKDLPGYLSPSPQRLSCAIN